MSTKKTIVVLGATGSQGGSVVQTFLAHSNHYHVRAVTRNASSAKGQALIAKGVEVVEADASDRSSLNAAFRGANIIFSTTDFWGAVMNPKNQAEAAKQGTGLMQWAYANEFSQGKNVLDAAAQTDGLERLIFSGLANVSRWSGGKYTHVYHFDAKAHAADYAKELHPKLWAKTSIIQAGWYLENWRDVPSMHPKKDEAGAFDFLVNVPAHLKLPLVATQTDLGPLVKALVEEEHAGKNLIAYREYMSMTDMVAAWSEVTKSPAKVTSVMLDLKTDNDMVRELAEGYAFWEEFGYEARDDPSVIHPSQLTTPVHLGSVKDWIAEQDWTNILQGLNCE